MQLLFKYVLSIVVSTVLLAGCTTPISGSHRMIPNQPMQKIDPQQLNIAPQQYRLGAKDAILVQVHPVELIKGDQKIDKGNQLRITFNYDKATKAAYKIVAGDELSLEFPDDAETAFQVAVSPDGKVTLPRIGKNVRVEGLTIAELNNLTSKEYRNLYLTPKASWGVVSGFNNQIAALSGNYPVGSDGEILIDRIGTLKVIGLNTQSVESMLSDITSKRFNNQINANVSIAKINVREQPDNRLTPSGLEMYLNVNNLPLRVSEDGLVYVPSIGDVPAEGKTIPELKADIQLKVQALYQNPVVVNVAMQEYADNNVFIGGEVRQPGRYPFAKRMSLLKLIATAGWVNEFGDMTNVVLLRAVGENDYVIYRTNLQEVIEAKGVSAQDFKITPHDLVVVLPTSVAKANRFISQYVKGVLPFGANVSYNINSRGDLQ